MTRCAEDKEKNLPFKYRIIADSIAVGKDKAILLSDLMIIADVDRRSAHLIIETLINRFGYVIGASRKGENRGYYIPANDKEFNEIAHTFKNTINSMNKRYTSLVENYKTVGGGGNQ